MALAATLIWEVWTTGSDNNGGAYKPGASGTDFSQQAAAQFALTGVTSAGAGAIALTASAAATMVGNTVRVVSGTNFTVGTYEIISVVAGVSLTVDRNLTTGAGATGVLNVGGALATIAAATARWAASNIAYVKATGTHTVTATITLASGLNDLPNVTPNALIGYTSSRTDNGQVTITTATNTLALITVAMCNVIIANFDLNCASTTTSIGMKITASQQDRGTRVCNVKVRNFTSKGISTEGGASGSGPILQNCYVTAGSSAASGGFSMTASPVTCIDCVASGNSCSGFTYGGQNGAGFFIRCIAASNKTGGTYQGFDLSSCLGNTLLVNCVAYDNSGSGVLVTGTYNALSIMDSIFVSNAAYGIDFGVTQTPATPLLNYNAFYNNTTAARHNMTAGLNDVTLTGDPFVAAASGDFALNTTASAGASCRAAGFTGAFPNGTTTGFIDLGAAQHADPVGTGVLLYAVE